MKNKSPLNAGLFFGVVVILRYVFIDFLRAIMSEFPDYKKVSVEKLIPYARNSRTHSAEQVDQIAASIKEFGFLNPIITDGENGIVAGHGRVMAAKKLGLKELPCIDASHLTETQRRAYIIADNKIAINSDWDTEMLRVEFDELKEADFDLELTGFSLDEINALTPDELVEGLTDEDSVPDAPETPVSVLGDIWQLGNHRLMCGDSTNVDDVNKLINGSTIDLVHTDPPYGINWNGDQSGRGGISKGNKLKSFKDDTIEIAVDAFNLCEALGIKRQVWWGANYYAHHVPQTANWFVWDKRVEEKQKDTQSDCELAYVKSKWASVRIFRHLWKGLIKGSEHGQARVHPTQKPVALARWVFDYYKDVSTVMDLFGGSGFNIIACEETDRSCFTMEFESHYVDVIINRWQQFTGKEAVHIETGKTYEQLKMERCNEQISE